MGTRLPTGGVVGVIAIVAMVTAVGGRGETAAESRRGGAAARRAARPPVWRKRSIRIDFVFVARSDGREIFPFQAL